MIKTSVNTGVMSSGKVGVNRGVFICKNIYNRYSDLNAKQFMYATGISNNQIKDAIYRLCIDLKMAGIFDKCQAIYPFVGGTATSHSFNLIDPRNLDAAFRLQFFGGGTHSANGYQPGGVNGYANTFLIPNVTLNNLNSHMTFYSRTSAINANRMSMGSANGTYSVSNHLALKWSDGNTYGSISVNSNVIFANAVSTGFYIVSRTANNSLKLYKNNLLVGTNTTTITPIANTFQIFIGARNENTTPLSWDNKECAFASIGLGLTDAEAATYNTIVNNFQVTLNRNV